MGVTGDRPNERAVSKVYRTAPDTEASLGNRNTNARTPTTSSTTSRSDMNQTNRSSEDSSQTTDTTSSADDDQGRLAEEKPPSNPELAEDSVLLPVQAYISQQEEFRRWMGHADAGSRAPSSASATLPSYLHGDSDDSFVQETRHKKKKKKKRSDISVHERRVLYRPSKFLTYVVPSEYVSIAPTSCLPAYPHNALPFPWGVRLPLPKSQRNSPDLPVCSPLPLVPQENIMAFSYQHSSRHYQICADSKANQELEWL
ncbi:uncharacterized protein LOC131954609 [Physella acuta]|uniref:uncharacterized protein LOC131954609 n=1 Tax=Physella acuta TaxID=109671 RepID=UPI0027DCE05D|nr:uncharacterized protein LOC131954609 [Physella acuta]